MEEDNEFLDREQVLSILWNLIWASKTFETKSACALAYCEVRNLSFDTEFTLRKKFNER